MSGESPYFCIAPWVHVQIDQNGDIHPCCRSAREQKYGNWKETDLKDIWNGERLRKFRKDMLAGKRIASCQTCYVHEASNLKSHRQLLNGDFSEFMDLVSQTDSDGFLKSSEIPFLDLRFSNICNFKCRYCNHDSSSSWFKEYPLVVKDYPVDKAILRTHHSSEKLWSELETLLPKVKRIYFAGGEPCIDSDHYILLDKLQFLKRTDVELVYNTNLSHLNFQHWNLLEIWKRFPHVTVGVSLDGVGAQLELLRKGASWEDIKNNFLRIKEKLPHVRILIAPTIGALNAFHFIEAMRVWLQLGMIDSPESITVNFVETPDYLSLKVLNSKERQGLVDLYQKFSIELEESHYEKKTIQHIKNLLMTIIQMSEEEFNPTLRKKCAYFNISLDKLRKEKTIRLFPELFDLFYGS